MTNGNDQSQKNSKGRKAIRFLFFVVFIFIISGISSILIDRYLFSWLATRSWFENFKFLKKGMDNVMVINKTEQVTVGESQTISGYTSRSASSIVEITKRAKENKKPVDTEEQSRSGIIVTADGLVASYDGKFFDGKDTEYKVFVQDGKSFDGILVARDVFSNLVLLKLVGAENLPVAEFIAPEDIKVGMRTAVIGRSGFNAEISLRLGIASEWAKSYSVSGPLASSEKLQGVLFLDANSGDQWNETLAGGAVVDYNGDIIGILGDKKENTGVKFFVVPVNHLKFVIDQYLAKGKIERATLGVYYISLSREMAYLARNNFEKGALVYSSSGQQGLAVIAGSAADEAGIKIGDIILSVNGEEVDPDQNLAYLISKYRSGDKVELKIARNGEEMNVSVILQ